MFYVHSTVCQLVSLQLFKLIYMFNCLSATVAFSYIFLFFSLICD